MKDWAGVADAYARSFAQACAGSIQPMLDATAAPPGRAAADGRARADDARQHVSTTTRNHLDVGCGDGRLAAEAAARGRGVTACDADEAMCALTRRTVPNINVVNAALPDLPHETGTFDVVTANFVLNHVADPGACARELVRVACPGGIVAATIWPAGGAGFGELLGPVFGQPNVVPLQNQALPAALDFERTAGGLAQLLTEAGLRDVAAHDISWAWRVSPDDLWAGIAAGVATPGLTYLAQTLEVRAKIERTFFEKAASMARAGFLTFTARGAMAIGQAR